MFQVKTRSNYWTNTDTDSVLIKKRYPSIRIALYAINDVLIIVQSCEILFYHFRPYNNTKTLFLLILELLRYACLDL